MTTKQQKIKARLSRYFNNNNNKGILEMINLDWSVTFSRQTLASIVMLTVIKIRNLEKKRADLCFAIDQFDDTTEDLRFAGEHHPDLRLTDSWRTDTELQIRVAGEMIRELKGSSRDIVGHLIDNGCPNPPFDLFPWDWDDDKLKALCDWADPSVTWPAPMGDEEINRGFEKAKTDRELGIYRR